MSAQLPVPSWSATTDQELPSGLLSITSYDPVYLISCPPPTTRFPVGQAARANFRFVGSRGELPVTTW